MKTGERVARQAILNKIHACETELDAVLTRFEQSGQLEQALQAYWQVEVHLDEIGLDPQAPEYPNLQAVLAQCLLRQANIMRQFGQLEKAAELNLRELSAAWAAADSLTLARSLISYGATRIVHGERDDGLACLEEACRLFEANDGKDFRQGLGWYWIVRADLDNARITTGGPLEALAAADRALAILEPLGN